MLARTRPTVWIGILAMLAQLVLPTVHAAAYAQRHANPLAYAICGIGSPALLAQMRERLPTEVLDRLERQNLVPDSPDCGLCGAVHGTAAAGAAAAGALSLSGSPGTPARPLQGAVAATIALPPPARGPPTPA